MNAHDAEQLETHMEQVIKLIQMYHGQLVRISPLFNKELIDKLTVSFAELCWKGELGKGYRHET